MGNGAAGTVLGAAAGEHHAKTHPANAAGNGTGTHGGIVGTGASAGTVGKEILGKVEHAIGTVMGSSTLKARGAEKEQYVHFFFSTSMYIDGYCRGSRSAQSEKLQNAELAQAKRLEGEAAVRREHAADQG